MAQLTITIGGTNIPEKLDVLSRRLMYQNFINNPDFDDMIPEDAVTNPRMIDNPTSKADHIRNYIVEHIKALYREQILNEAVTASLPSSILTDIS